MPNQQHKPNSDFIKNIEEAIKEHGNLACPNPECNHKLVSKKRINEKGNTTLEYHCLNQSCHYHKKRQIPIGIEATIAPKETIPVLNRVTYPKIFTVAGFILLGILSYTSYQLYAINNYIDNEMVEHKIEKQQKFKNVSPTAPKEKARTKSISYDASRETTDDFPIDILEFTQQTQTWIDSKNFEQGKKNLQKLITNENYKAALLDEGFTKECNQLINLIADSYDKSGSAFTLHLLQNKKDFALLQEFIKIFDQDQKLKNVLLGKAYLNFPNFLSESISIGDRKKMQLLGLKFYLKALKEGRNKSYEKSAINAVNEIAKAYRIFKHNPKKPRNFLPIEKLLKQGKRDMIQYRIEYVESILNRIS